MQYYYADGDQQKGPLNAEQLRAAGVKPDTLVWREGMAEWQRADAVAELAGAFARPAGHGGGDVPVVPPVGGASPHGGYAPQPPAGFVQPGFPPPGYAPPGHPGHGPGQQLQYGGYAPVQAAPSNGMSIVSLVLGILAIPATCTYGLGVPLAILAVIFGHIGHASSKRQTGQANGMAVAGLVCGYICLALVLAIVLIVFVFVGAAASGAGGRRGW